MPAEETCYHVVRWHSSMRATVELQRCFTRAQANSAIRKDREGVTGDRADYQIDPKRTDGRLSVVKCQTDDCDCRRWMAGHNAGRLAPKEKVLKIMCSKCGKWYAELCEYIDPKTEEPVLVCRAHYNEFFGKRALRSRELGSRTVRASDPSMSLIAQPVEKTKTVLSS